MISLQYCRVHVCEVLQYLKDSIATPPPTPFAQSAQYKKTFDDSKDDDDDGELAEAPAKKNTKKKKRKGKKPGPAQVQRAKKKPSDEAVQAPAAGEVYQANRYSELRTDFINKLKESGVKYQAAAEQWNNSDLKRQLLANVPLPELKKRRFVRFVTKDCTTNPWAC